MRKYTAEFIGTFALIFCGTGAVIINHQTNSSITHVGVAITWGLIVMSMIYALGNISGAHLNPAVSIAFYLSGRFSMRKVLPFIISQCAGAMAAGIVLSVLFPNNDTLGATLPVGSAMQSFIIEIILSFFLMMVILKVATGSKEQGMFARIAIGGVIGLEAMFAGPVCGASMNPARSLAPVILSHHL